MNDLRKELERQFEAHGLFDDQAENEVSDNPKGKAEQAETSQASQNEEDVIKALLAPSSYRENFASDFKNLPHEWQVFLIEHENENNEKYQKALDCLQEYRLLEAQYDAERLRLQQQGVQKIREWLDGLIWIDKEMARRPEQTLRAMAKVYGVNLGGDKDKSTVSAETMARLNYLEQGLQGITHYLSELQNQKIAESLQMFGRQTDPDGNLLHPYFEAVQKQMYDFLESGMVQSVEDAYEYALWLNPQIRSELVEKQISSQAAEAQKAQKAAFAPKGKTEAPERPLTLREELEKNMAAFMD